MRITRYLKYYIWGSWLNLVLYMVYCKSLHATCCIVKNGISCYNYFMKQITFMEEITWPVNIKIRKTLRLKQKYII